jgi:hypothetical protein
VERGVVGLWEGMWREGERRRGRGKTDRILEGTKIM